MSNDPINSFTAESNTELSIDERRIAMSIDLNDNSTVGDDSAIDDRIEKVQVIIEDFFKFGLDYSTILFQNHGNIVTSPIGVASLMFLGSYGACSRTQNAMNVVSTFPNLPQNDLELIKLFIDRHSELHTSGIFIGYKIFLSDNIELSEKFLNISQRIFNSKPQQINFSNTGEATQIINNWSANQTANNVTNVMSPSQLNSETNLILISVASFNSMWLKPFDPINTKLMDFLVNGMNIKVWTMNQEIECRFGVLEKLDNSSYVELPFRTTNTKDPLRMIIILPRESTSLSKIVPNLSKLYLQDLYLNAASRIRVNISLPKFKINSRINLQNYSKAMGIDVIFSDAANFNRITKSRDLKVNNFIQISIIHVNEGMTYQSKSSSNAKKNGQKSKNFHINRPFIALIASKDKIFASAQIVDPRI